MSHFNPEKLHIKYSDIDDIDFPSRKYTLTHSDMTGELFLSIGAEYEYKKLSSIYTRLMRDEVLGEWMDTDQPKLNIHCHVSGGIAFGPAGWRASIFRQHMPMVLQAICYGDRSFLAENRRLMKAPIFVFFHSTKKSLDVIEKWGIIDDFMPINK